MNSTQQNITELRQAEQALLDSEARFRSFVENSFDVIFILDSAGIFRYVCPSWEQHFGYPAAEVIGGLFSPVVHPDDVQPCFDYLMKVMSTGQPGTSPRYRVKCADGSWKLFIANGSRFIDSQGEVLFHGIGRDISAQDLMLNQLMESEERFRIIIEESPISMAVVSMDGTIEYINTCAIETFGYQPEDIPNMNDWWQKAYPDPVYRDQVIALWMGLIEQAIAENRYIERREYLTTCKNGTVKTMLIFGVLLSGKVFVMFEDISERKTMELDLRESEARYRRFIATANEGVSITDQDYNITYVNDRFAEMLGYEPQELIGVNVDRLLHPEEQRSFPAHTAARRRGESSQRECWHLRKDGSKAWLLTSSSPIIDESGIFQGCFAMFTDLTKRQQAEIALQQSHEELECKVSQRTAALAEATEKITKMSFELLRVEEQERTRIAAELHDHVGQYLLLAKIKSDTLAGESPADEARSAAAAISVLLESTIHDIRTLTFGMRAPLLDTAGVEAALEWLCAALYRDYNLQVECSFSCRPLQLAAEKRYPLYQSIRELLLNVVKHAGVSRAVLSLQVQDGVLEVRVVDAGAGFDQTVDQVGLTAGGGFGLFSVQQRIGYLGGRLDFVSSAAGTEAILTMPLQ